MLRLMEVDMVRMLLLRRRQERRRWTRQLNGMRHHAIWQRNLRDEMNPFEMPESNFMAKYRLSREVVCNLVEELRPYMKGHQRTTAIPLHLKVLTTLHFLGHGSVQKGVGADNVAAMSQPSVSRCIDEVVKALNVPAVLRAGVPFPDTREERFRIMQRNFRCSSIHGVIGYVEGAHVIIAAPDVHEEQYVNRHGTHSLNVQVACDSDMMIINILARYPGSSSDSFVWASSALRSKIEELYRGGEECWLLGDSGYPNEPWLHIPVTDPLPNSREASFNQAHMIAISIVKKTIGHLRNRFRCLNKHRVLEYNPVKAGFITNACAVLHNKCVTAHIPLPQSEADHSDSSSDEDAPPPVVNEGHARDRLLQEARVVRAGIIARLPPLPPGGPYNPCTAHSHYQR
ncbi:putative nuclease HARBI1 isoform X1 [Schistocerca nitens]|uniref:putative nuclease HARBI1 isoform X1 n=2 Tax=Schistocerca nitens TaxID=7011 RepID=UPI0021194A3C|nr:putative nuclease HARBI1 isoform X1 [Schistocerca nitens]